MHFTQGFNRVLTAYAPLSGFSPQATLSFIAYTSIVYSLPLKLTAVNSFFVNKKIIILKFSYNIGKGIDF